MSDFNTANELASELVFGTNYQTGEPFTHPERLVFVDPHAVYKTEVVTATEQTHAEWARVGSVIEGLLRADFRLGCDMDISWNGEYDTDGDPIPGKEYQPCGKQVAVTVGDRNYCLMHLEAAGGKPQDVVADTGDVEEL
jgi:hypothetical protein